MRKRLGVLSLVLLTAILLTLSGVFSAMAAPPAPDASVVSVSNTGPLGVVAANPSTILVTIQEVSPPESLVANAATAGRASGPSDMTGWNLAVLAELGFTVFLATLFVARCITITLVRFAKGLTVSDMGSSVMRWATTVRSHASSTAVAMILPSMRWTITAMGIAVAPTTKPRESYGPAAQHRLVLA